MTGNIRPAVFIDRDGTLSEEIGYINHASRFRLLPRSPQAVRLLNEHGILAIITTNQAGVARGYFPEERIHEVHERMTALLAADGAHLDGIYYCPHHPGSGVPPYRADCDCRKPKTGLITRAADELAIDVAASYVVGDRFSDIELAANAGCKSVFVLTGYGLGLWEYDRGSMKAQPDFVAGDLLDAVHWILADMGILSRG